MDVFLDIFVLFRKWHIRSLKRGGGNTPMAFRRGLNISNMHKKNTFDPVQRGGGLNHSPALRVRRFINEPPPPEDSLSTRLLTAEMTVRK